MKATVEVQAGVCGFVSNISASSADGQHVSFTVDTDCEKIGKLRYTLKPVDAFNEIKEGFKGELYGLIQSRLGGCCAGCAVQVGLFKAMQVAAGLALPKEVKIEISKSE